MSADVGPAGRDSGDAGLRAPARIAGLLLAAGASRRLGTPKQLLTDAQGVPLVVRAVRQLLEAGCRPVVVVTGARAREVESALGNAGLAGHAREDRAPSVHARTGGDVITVHNAAFADGMGRSIACGVSALAADPACVAVAAVLIATCDMPTVAAPHFVALMVGSQDGQVRVASSYLDKVSPENADNVSLLRGIPAVLPRSDWEWLTALDSDRGAKPLLMQPETVTVPLARGTFDLDTPADVAAWRADPERAGR